MDMRIGLSHRAINREVEVNCVIIVIDISAYQRNIKTLGLGKERLESL